MTDRKLSQVTPLSALTGTEVIYAIINTGSVSSPVWVEKQVTLSDVLTFGLSFFVGGLTGNSEMIFRHISAVPFWLPAGLPGSQLSAGTAAAASTVYSIKKNGALIGLISFAAGATVPTISFAAKTYFAAGDLLTITAPTLADGMLADIAFNLKATRGEP
jgi:hypothetical protein